MPVGFTQRIWPARDSESAVLLGLLYLVAAGKRAACRRWLRVGGRAARGLTCWRHPRSSGTSPVSPAFGLLILLPGEWLRIEPGPYKPPESGAAGAGVPGSSPNAAARWAAFPVVEKARAECPLRYAPGLSLNSTAEPPTQLGVFTDGDNMDAITATTADPQRLGFLEQMTAAPRILDCIAAIRADSRRRRRSGDFTAHCDSAPRTSMPSRSMRRHWQLLREEFS